MAAGHGQLELNAFMPIIADSLLNSLEIMKNSIKIFREKCIEVIKANENTCSKHLINSTALATALVNHIGYDKATEISKKALSNDKSIKEILLEDKIMSKNEADKILNPYQVTKPGIPGL